MGPREARHIANTAKAGKRRELTTNVTVIPSEALPGCNGWNATVGQSTVQYCTCTAGFEVLGLIYFTILGQA